MKKIFTKLINLTILVLAICLIPNNIAKADVEPYATFEFNIPVKANVPSSAYSLKITNDALMYANGSFYKMESGLPVSMDFGECFEVNKTYRVAISGIPSASYDDAKPCTLDIGGEVLSINVNGNFSRSYPQNNVGYTTSDSLSFSACFEFVVTEEARVLTINPQIMRYYTIYSSIEDEVTENGKAINSTCKVYDNDAWSTIVDEIDGYQIWHNVKIDKGEYVGDYDNGDVIIVNGSGIAKNDSCGYNNEGYKIDDSGIDIYFSTYAQYKEISIPGIDELEVGTTKANIESIIANALGTEYCPSDLVESITIDSLYEYQSGASANAYKLTDFTLSDDLDSTLELKRYKLILKMILNKDFSDLNYNASFVNMSTIGKNSFGYDDSVKPTSEREMLAIVSLNMGKPRLVQVDSYYDEVKDIYAMSNGNDSTKVSFKVEGKPITSVSWKIDGVAAPASFTFEKDKVYNVNLVFDFTPKDEGCRVNNTDLAISYSVGDNQYFFDESGIKGYKYCIILNYKFVCEDKPVQMGGGSKTYKVNDKDTAEKISGSGKKGSTRTITPIEGKKVASVIVTDKNGNKVDVTLNEDGTYSFKQPASDVNIEVNYKNREITLNIGSTEASVDGETSNLDVAPILRNDRTMLPIRFVAENLGAKVDWDEKNPDKVIISRRDIKIEITLGSDIAKVNGKEFKLDSVAVAENDRTYLPVRFVSEALNAIVEWNESKPNEVKIYEQ